MTAAGLIALGPIIALGAAAVIVMLVIGFVRHHGLIVLLSATGLLTALASLYWAAAVTPIQVTPLMLFDGYALFFSGLIMAGALAVAALGYSYFAQRSGVREEWYLLLLLATLGAVVLVGSAHFASLFIGLELLSVSLFAMVGYTRAESGADRRSLEAAMKYLILSGVASPLMLFGMALLYAELGTLEFTLIAIRLGELGYATNLMIPAGMALLVAGISFKLSLVPFHLWTPDVYEGAPAPTTAFLATVSKGAIFALLLRYLVTTGAYQQAAVLNILMVIAVASMLVGNLLALLQTNVKRILAYSSIAHMGYLLVPLIVGGALAVEGVIYYLFAYFVMTIGAFGVVGIYSADTRNDRDALSQYRGLFWSRPWLAGSFTLMLLALAGIPLTAGFIAKFYALAAGVEGQFWILVGALILGSAIGLFYYLRIVITLFRLPEQAAVSSTSLPQTAFAGCAAMAAVTFLLLWFGLLPETLIEWIRAAGIAQAAN